MNFIAGLGMAGLHIAAGPIDSGGAVVALAYPEIDQGFNVWCYDSQGQVVNQITSDAFKHPLVSLEFEILETGPGAFKMVLAKNSPITLTNTQRIDIALFGAQAPWYSGTVMKTPHTGSTEQTLAYSGYGWFGRLDKIRVNKTYENTEVSAAVADLAQTVINAKEPRIQYRASKIYSTGYTLEKLVFDFVKGSDALKTLSEFAVDYVYGIDELREVFFRPRITTINEKTRLWVGQHLHEFVPDDDQGGVVNFFYVKYGKLTDGSNYYSDVNGNPIPFTDPASIAAYGQSEDVLDLPAAVTGADVERWAYNQLDQLKNPKPTAKVGKFDPVVVRRNIRPEGNAAITAANGVTYQYPIKSVKYVINGQNGITMSMTLGDVPERIDRQIARILRDARMAELLQQMNAKQLSGGSI